MPTSSSPRLSLSHTTLAVRDLDAMLDFYREVLGFVVTNRGEAPGGSEMAFISQDPAEHHQIVFISGLPGTDRQFVMLDHLAFRTNSLDDLRAIGVRLEEAGVDGVIPISHGNAWPVYFTDPEGNGLECFVDSPFHAASRTPMVSTSAPTTRRSRPTPREDPGRRRVPVDGGLAGAVPGSPRRRCGGRLTRGPRNRGCTALICASSRGLGFACADSLGREGVHLVINGRDEERLAGAADELRGRHRVEVSTVAGDIAEAATRDGYSRSAPSPTSW